MSKKQFAEWILETLRNCPDGWEFGGFSAQFGSVKIWIANRPYADLTVNDRRIGTWWQRRKIRKMMDSVMFSRLRVTGDAVMEQVSKESVDEALRRLAKIEGEQ